MVVDGRIKPKITIITVTYNCDKFLERAILSVINQGYSNLEYIIVDGGSTDGTLDIIRKYNNNIDKWISEQDKGISDAFNKGIRMSTGDVIGIINSDDGLMPNALNIIADVYNKDIDVYRGKVMLWKEDTNSRYVEIPSMHFRFDGRNNISHQSTFVSRKAYEKFGMFDEKIQYVMDYDLFLRFERMNAVFYYVDEILAFYTLGGITFGKYTQSKRKETSEMLVKNGANKFDLIRYFAIKYGKILITKAIGKNMQMKFKHKKYLCDTVTFEFSKEDC